MTQQMIKLRVGWLRISEASDPDYPGVWVEVLDENLSVTKAQVLIEEPIEGITRALIWKDGEQDDYDEEIKLTEGEN